VLANLRDVGTALQGLRQRDRRLRFALIDGPNMPNLGFRDRRIYGGIESIGDLHEAVAAFADGLGVQLTPMASNYEGQILDFIHEQQKVVDGFLINPAGLTKFGEPTRYALAESGIPTVEVHFANIARLGIPSLFTPTVTAAVTGLRHYGYVAAVFALTMSLDDEDFLGAEHGSASRVGL
jgi:3-dehydroquinate dehydratase-2